MIFDTLKIRQISLICTHKEGLNILNYFTVFSRPDTTYQKHKTCLIYIKVNLVSIKLTINLGGFVKIL